MEAINLAPPPEQTFDTYEKLQSAVQSFAKQHGYAVVIGRSNRDRKGNINLRTLTCAKGGIVRDRVVDRKKPLISQKTQCPFRCRAELQNGHWVLVVKDPRHNHSAEDPIAFHQYRQLPDTVRFQIAAMTRAGIMPKAIASTLSQTYPDQLWRMQDIYNLRRTLKAELLNGRSPIEAMLHELHSSCYEYNYLLDSNGHITMLFFAHLKSLELLRQYSEVLLMDCTYKTNRFQMPLLDILGSTDLGKTFYAAFVFLSGETEMDYREALRMLCEVLEKRNISCPGVIVTDCDTALMKAISFSFPTAKNLLCLWHINKNVLMHGQRHGIFQASTEKEEEFLKIWNQLIAASSIDEYDLRLSVIQNTYRQYPHFLRYLDNTWLQNHKERFVQYWTNRYLHFGHRETSRAEGAHSVIKRYLQVSTGDLNSVLASLALMLENQHSEHKAAIAAARNRTPQCFLVPML
jgi:MULE transposase domain/FAR1 DNA-binding domain